VVDLEDVDLTLGERRLLRHATWRLGPGDRVGLVGVNGAGKTSVLRLVAGDLRPDHGRVKRGRTVALEHLSQVLDHLDPQQRVLDSVEGIKRVTTVASGEITASSMLERFGFTGDRLTARIGDLSGGERRRLQMLRLLLTEPNVLLLDEPTNDLDIETLTVLEDFLDGWPGTLVVVSHDRYFLERVTDSTWALLGDGQVSLLPRGVDEYLERRAADLRAPTAEASRPAAADPLEASRPASTAERRDARKTVTRVERQLAKLAERETQLHAEMVEHASDYERLATIDVQLREVTAQKDALEEEWLEAATLLE
jgi:ABC transport system ATP-binding/permease protein